MRETLLEVTRQQLLDRGKSGANYVSSNQHKGRNRYERRKYQKVSRSVATYNEIDMNSFFKKDILLFKIDVKGETNDYKVQLKFIGVLEEIKKALKRNNDKLEFKVIREGVMQTFLHGDVYVSCDCDDFKYRFRHFSHIGNFSSERPGDDPGPGKRIANPNNDKGPACKHILAVLANKDWVMKVSSTINNYINYMQDTHEDVFNRVMYPVIYGKKFVNKWPINVASKPTSLRKANTLKTDKERISKANQYGRDRNKFKKGNTQGIRFTKNDDGEDRVELDNVD